MSHFVQLSKDECSYLLDLIAEMDSETTYTAKQRGYTVPKLERIGTDPRCARLAFQDIEYLLDLIEDDELEEFEQIREMCKQSLEEIRQLQQVAFRERISIEEQREVRRTKRLQPGDRLKRHFQHANGGEVA